MLRVVAGLSLLICVGLSLPAPAIAQDGTVLLTAEQLGLPELVIAATDNGWDAPSEVTAGRYLVTVSYEGDGDYGTTAFLKLPDGWTLDDLNQRFEASAVDPNPIVGDGTNVSLTVPDLTWLYDLTLAGGVSPVPGGTSQGIVDLSAGNWAIWGDSFGQPAIPLTVTGEPPAIQSIPESSVTITGVSDDGAFGFQIDGSLSTGLQIIEIRNESSQPMYIEFLALSSPASAEQLSAFLDTSADLEPDPSLDIPTDFAVAVTPFYSGIQSDGTVQWIVTNFEPGSYGMACWLPDPENGGVPHASRGMIDTFEIS